MNSKPSNDERNFAVLSHLLSFIGFVGIPLGNILGPLVIWLIKRHDYELVNRCGKESLNFQISMSIYAIIAAALVIILIGWFALVVLFIIDVYCVIKASILASRGEVYEYPFTIRLIK